MQEWRNPPKGEPDWKVARSSSEALELVIAHGPPEFIDFDHDLGVVPDPAGGVLDTSMKFLKELEARYPDCILDIKGYAIHSANPEGSKNIRAFMESWRRSKTLP